MDRYLSQAAISIATVLFATIAALIGAVFVCGAVYLALSEIMRPPLAALVTGINIIVFSAAVIAVARLLVGRSRELSFGRARKRGASPGLDENRVASDLGNLLGKQIHDLASANAPATVLVSLAAGFVVGLSPSVRKFLIELLT
jgi:hypothetical protein